MTTWHADTALLRRYAGGDLDDARAFSLEAHLLACAECRTAVTRHIQTERLEGMWTGITATLDAPRPRLVERLLVAIGVRQHAARLLAATPSLQGSWFGACALALAFGVLAARAGERGLLAFLVLAPLLPLAGVAASFGPGIDPTYEVGVAAPMRGARLFLLRALAVTGATTVLTAAASLALPVLDWRAAAWLLPALAVALCGLALSTVVGPLQAAGGLGIAWVTGVSIAVQRSADLLVAFRPAAQVVFGAIVVVCGVAVAWRRDSFDLGRF